jgi:hypothetical protein
MKKTILIAAVMLFALSTVAMAQSVGARFTVASVPETFVSCCGQTERTGSIGFQSVPGSPDSVTGTITVTYAVPVTNTGTAGITVAALAPTNPPGGTAPVVTINQVVPSDASGRGVVVLNVGAGGIYPYSITLSGVRVNVSGACAGSIGANITSTGNFITSGETSVVVISNVRQALKTPTLAAAAITVNAVTGTPSAGTFNLRVEENFLDAFGKTPTGDPTQNISKLIRLSVSKVPAGVTLTFPVTTASLFTLASSAGALQATAATVTNATSPATIYYRLVTDSLADTTEKLDVIVGVAVSTATLPLSGPAVTISAHVAPIDTAVPQTLIPRYTGDAECETATVQVLSIFGASTTLLVPYATNQSALFGYNTGLAVANTTLDPTTAVMGFTQAVRQTGSMTFYFFKTTPATDGNATTFNYTTTAGSPGTGLNADGTLSPGKEYVVLLDQLLTAAGQSKDFTGNIFIVTNFTNAHGQYFITNFAEFTNGALMLVVNNDSAGRAGPEKLDN